MHFDWKGIMEGAFNSVFVNKEIEKVAKFRSAICRNCPHDSVNKEEKLLNPLEHCTLCGCNIHMKTRSMSQNCPDKPPRWTEVIDAADEMILDQKLTEAQKKT